MASRTALLPADPACAGDPAAELHACLDQLAAYDVEHLDPVGQGALLSAVTRAESRLAALRLRMLAVAERSRAAAVSGAASTGQWAASLANADQIDTHRQVRLAQGLVGRAATRQALAAGALSPAHAAVIVQADRDLPAAVSAAQRVTVEEALVEKAKQLSPQALRRVARRSLAAIEAEVSVVDAHEDGLVAAEEGAAFARARLTLHDNLDGTVTGHFTVPTARGQLLRKVLETMTSPRRGRSGARRAQVGAGARPISGDDWDHARGLAFGELLEHLPTDHLHPKTAATLVVTVEIETLRAALKVAQLDTGAALSSGEVRRMACGAQILPAVLGGRSVPLDLGRSARLYSETQRVAVGINHPTCAADGCERPFAWCELHHWKPWRQGGRTDLDEAVPLCGFHHRRIHDPGYRHRRDPRSGAISFEQRLGSPRSTLGASLVP